MNDKLCDGAIFKQALALQQRWPGATWTSQLFPRSAWWAMRQMLVNAPENAPEDAYLTVAATREEEAIPAVAGPAGRVLLVADQALTASSLELLERMTAAMHLSAENFAIWPNHQDQSWRDLAGSFRPKVVLALGSAALEMLTQRRERLSQVHGTFMPLNYPGGSCTMMPIFHPDFILINPAMKRPVWQDLQKVMRFLAE